jgi:copper chaperone CopZ
MYKIFFLLLILLTLKGSPAQAQFVKADLQASGLTCSMCSNAIQKALKQVTFVESVQTDLNKNIFTLTFRKDMPVDFDVLKKKVEGAGFSISGFWVTANLGKMDVANDEHVELSGLHLHFMHVRPQSVAGVQRLRVIDKGFVSQKEFKTCSTYTSMPCYQSGVMASCCNSRDGKNLGTGRIYHVTL